MEKTEGPTYNPSQDERERMRTAEWECLDVDDPIMIEIVRRLKASDTIKQTSIPARFRLALSNHVYGARANIWTEGGVRCNDFSVKFARGGTGFRVSPTLPRVAAEVVSVADDLESILGRLMNDWIEYPIHRYGRDTFAFAFTLWHTKEVPGHLILLYMYRIPYN